MTVFKWCLHDPYICREENVVFGYKIIKQIGNLDTCISIVFCIVMCLPYSYVPHSTLGMQAEPPKWTAVYIRFTFFNHCWKCLSAVMMPNKNTKFANLIATIKTFFSKSLSTLSFNHHHHLLCSWIWCMRVLGFSNINCNSPVQRVSQAVGWRG